MRRDIRVECCSLVDAGCDVVVNASNAGAALGSGVSRAVFDECGGLILQTEMREKLEAELDGNLGVEDCLVTSGGTSTRLRHVLHVASVDYTAAGKGLMSTAARVTLATGAALTRAAELGSTDAPVQLAFPLLGAGHGGLGVGASVKAMVEGLKRFFHANPGAPIARIVFAVPEVDKCELAKSRLDQLLVLR